MFPSSSEFATDPESPPRRRPMAIAVTVLIVVMVGAVGALALMIRDNRGTPSRSGTERRTVSTSTSTRPTTTTSVPPRRYVVREGDSLTGIARRFGVSVVRLSTVNEIVDANLIAPGQELRIPRVRLAVDPATVTAGESVSIRLTGAGPSETVTFDVASLAGSHTGAPHVASPEGVVTATYRTAADDPVGAYAVTARGGQGTRVERGFTVRPPTG